MLHSWVERADQAVIAGYKTFFFVVGSFGNSCFIYIIWRNKQLRSKSTYLQCIQCFCHIICLTGTLVDVVLVIPDIQLSRNICFPLMSPFVFFEAAQAVIMLELVTDILIIVKYSGFYKTFETWRYILLSLIAPSIAGGVFAVWGFEKLDDEDIYFCNPTSSLHTVASINYTRCLVIINTLIITVFLVLILIFHRKSQNENSDSRKVMKRLQFSVAIFLGSWYITIFSYYVCIAVGVTGEDLHFVINNMSFFISLCYSQTFYVIIYKSMEYRKVFFELMHIRKTSQNVSKASTTRVVIL